MYCKNCGKKIADDSKFCLYCGTKLFDEDSEVSEQKETEYAWQKEEKQPEYKKQTSYINSEYSNETRNEQPVNYDEPNKYDTSDEQDYRVPFGDNQVPEKDYYEDLQGKDYAKAQFENAKIAYKVNKLQHKDQIKAERREKIQRVIQDEKQRRQDIKENGFSYNDEDLPGTRLIYGVKNLFNNPRRSNRRRKLWLIAVIIFVLWIIFKTIALK